MMPVPAAPTAPPVGNGAPSGAVLPQAAGQQPMLSPLQMAQQQAEQVFGQICKLLKNDKMRTFRIDIETDSTIELDKETEKKAVVELFTAVGGFLEKAIPVGQAMPELTPALGQSILFAFRRFGVGRDVEGLWEQAIDQLSQKAKNPPPAPPSPEQIKAEAEKQKQQMENDRQQQQMAIDRQNAEFEMAMKEREAQLKEREMEMNLQFKERELALKAQEQQMAIAAKAHETQINAQAAERTAAIDEAAQVRKAQIEEQTDIRRDEMAQRADQRDAEAGERDFELGRKVAEAKAKEAVKPKPKKEGK